MFSEKGSLKDISAMKLLLTVFEQGLTGILYIKREDILKVLYFSRGKLIWAISNSDVDKLENILAAKGLVPMEAINNVKKQARVSDSIGKLLVEKGLITLEQLIESSKIQLKRIINSIFKWKDGGFQFVKEAPPERLLSLDLDVTQFVIDYIVDEVDISDIWKEIGSLQVEFIKNPDVQKVERYPLSDKQKELLNSFDGKQKLETILSRHSSGHRESLLKVIYFYLLAELLLKKEFDLSVLSTFDVEKSIDDLEATADEDKEIEPAEEGISLEPLGPIEPMGPMEPIEPTKPIADVDIADIEALVAFKPGKPGKPIEPGKPVEPMEPIEPAGPIEDIKVDMADIEAIEAIKPGKPGKPIEPINSIEPGKPVVPIEDIEPIPGIEDIEDIEDIEAVKPGKPGEPIEHREPIEDIKVDMADIEAIEAVKPGKPGKPVVPIEDFEPIPGIEDIEDIEDIEAIKPGKRIEDIEPIESIEPGKPIEAVKPIKPIEPIEHMEPIDRGKTEKSTTRRDDSPIFAGEPVKSARETPKDELEEFESTPPGYEEQVVTPIKSFSKIKEEKKRLKFFNIIMILIFLILVIGGVILLLLPMMESSDSAKKVVEKVDKNTTKDIVKIEEKTPPVKGDATPAGEIPGKIETGEPGRKPGEKKPGLTGKDQTPPTTSPTPGKTAESYFLEGSFITAGDVWKRELIKTGVKYGILLEMDCLRESVMNAYDKLPSKKDFYILNRTVGSKTCFLVMWGKFLSYEQAAEAIKSTSIPTYFWQQKDPPGIVELSKYL
jgi:hypothetical protein